MRPRMGMLRRAARWVGRRMGWSTDLAFMLGLRPSDSDVARPMEQNAAVYSGVRAIAQTVGGLPLVLTRAGQPHTLVERGPAYDLLNDGGALQEQWAGHLVEGGEAHILPQRGGATGHIRRLSVVGRRQMEPLVAPESGALVGWRFAPGGARPAVTLAADDVFTARLFNPYDAIRGLSPLAAAALGIKQDYAASLYNAAALENGSTPGGAIIFPDRVDKAEAREFLSELEARHQGAGNANRVLVLGGGADYKAVAWKNTDLDLFTGRKFSRDEIFNALGVPSVIVAIFESAHYDVADQSIAIFLQFTVQPLVRSLERLLNRSLLPRVEQGVEAHLDLTQHPVLQRLQLAKLDSLRKALGCGVTYNEAIRLTGLPLSAQEWGDTSLIEAGFTTVADVLAGSGAPPETAPAAEDEAPAEPAEEGTQARRHAGTEGAIADLSAQIAAAIASERRSQEAAIRRQIPMIRQRFRALFLQQERELLARLRALLGERGGQKSADVRGEHAGPARQPWERAADSEPERVAKRILLRIAEQQQRLRGLVARYFPQAIEQTLRAELARLKIEPARIDAAVKRVMGGRFVRAVLRAKQNKIVEIERTTRRQVVRTLSDGLGRGETVQQLADRVRAVMSGHRARALTIARTESSQAVTTARFAAAGAAGARYKAWMTGANPRPTHVKAGQDYAPGRGAIPMAEPFKVGSSNLMYPCDPAGEPGEIINCNCVMVTAARAGAGMALVNIIAAGAAAQECAA